MYRFIGTILLSAISSFSLSAQTIKPLTLGDTVPDITLRHILNYKDSTAKLSDFRGKLLIIDFWATSCTSCLVNFPRMDSLNNKYSGQLLILGDGYDDLPTAKKFFDNRKDRYGHPYHLPTIIGDTLLRQYFPHQLIPHSVWIGADGVVKAITAGKQVTEDKILAYLQTKQVDIAVKKDQPKNKPIFLSPDFPKANALEYYSILTKGPVYYGYGSGNLFHRIGNTMDIHGRGMTNLPLKDIYLTVVIALFDKIGVTYSHNRFVTRFAHPDTAHRLTDYYNFDIVVPVSVKDSLFTYALADLNRYSGLHGRIARQLTHCLILTAPRGTGSLRTKGGTPVAHLTPGGDGSFLNQSFARLSWVLEELPAITYPILDATGYRGNVDLVLSGRKDLPSIQADLRRYGLELTEADREIDMFILSD